MGRERECTGKHRHDTKAAAEHHVSRRRRHYGATQVIAHAYHCRFCGGWHVGHRKNRRR